MPEPAPTPDAPPAKPSRWKKVLLAAVGGLLLLVLLLPTMLSSGFVRGKVLAKASEAAGRHVGAASIDVGWSATSVRDLEVRWGPGASDPVLARVGEIRVPAG